MNILHVTSSLDPRHGGVAEALRQFGAALVRQGHRTEIATGDAPGSPWLEGYPVPTHALGPTRGSYQHIGGLRAWLAARRERYDCVISHGLWQHHGFAAWQALRGMGTPRFVFAHGMLDPWFKRAHPLKHFKKWLYWPWGEYRVLRDARAVFFTCEEERRLARESFWLYRCNEAVANLGLAEPPDGAERQTAAFHARFPELAGQRIILYLGRLHPKKGADLLLEAWTAQPGWRLVMAGPGEGAYVDRLKAAAGPDVTWAGMLEGDVKWGALRAAEAFVLPSHQENFGIAVAEALSCGCPVLISDKVNIWREIEADGAAFVESDTAAGVAKLLGRWQALPDDERAAMRTRARDCFAARFQIDRAAASLVDQLRRCGVSER